jgi:hypothetical protein
MSFYQIKKLAGALLFSALALPCFYVQLHAHGFEGDRFFPPTPLTDDPFAVDELALPIVQYNPASASHEVDVSGSFSKEIFPKFALSVSGTYINLNPKGGPAQDGFDNVDLNVKYQLWEVPAHEFILAIGSDVDLGGTGSRALGVNNYTTYTPNLYFGKGFNELPDALKYGRPFAFTGVVGYDLYANAAAPNALEWSGSLQYSLPYLQEHVEDIGLPRPFSDMIPLVEFSMTSPTNRSGGTTTGTLDPGVLWEGKYCQIGLEASIPVNDHSGPAVGGLFQVQIFIDDLFPKYFGYPIFGHHDATENNNSNSYDK